MILHVTDAKYKKGYRIWVRFNDGSEGVLKDELHGEMFKPLREIKKFRSFRVDPELETLVWINGADFAPEFLRDRLLVEAGGRKKGNKGTLLSFSVIENRWGHELRQNEGL
ncbi:MAG: DUF2442 domain-containing protein [Elusimicrobia bacterium]|nr:DUF2442 domain-containing protein [Elusimicrobiota bacterium]